MPASTDFERRSDGDRLFICRDRLGRKRPRVSCCTETTRGRDDEPDAAGDGDASIEPNSECPIARAGVRSAIVLIHCE